MIISHLVALSNNNVIGVDNDLPWRLKKDLQHFSAYTQNKVIVMGRKTFESLPKALPNRKNIVLSKNKNLKIDSVEIQNFYEKNKALFKLNEDIFKLAFIELSLEFSDIYQIRSKIRRFNIFFRTKVMACL